MAMVTNTCAHDCDMIVLGVRVDLTLQKVSAHKTKKSGSMEKSKLNSPEISASLLSAMLRDRRSQSTAISGPLDSYSPMGIYPCAHTALYLQFLCIRI